MNVLKKINIYLLVAISLGSIVISFADFFHLLENISFLKDFDYSKSSLLIISMLGLYFVGKHIEDESFENKTLDFLNDLTDTETNENVIIFENSTELETYLSYRIQTAKSEICDLTWKKKISNQFNVGKRKKSHSLYDNATKVKATDILYREIFIFNDTRRYKKFKRRLRENKDGYSCRYYNDELIPRLQFIIIDNKEVIFFASSENSLLCSIKGQNIGRIFKPYFNELWREATELIEGPNINIEEIEKLDKLYE